MPLIPCPDCGTVHPVDPPASSVTLRCRECGTAFRVQRATPAAQPASPDSLPPRATAGGTVERVFVVAALLTVIGAAACSAATALTREPLSDALRVAAMFCFGAFFFWPLILGPCMGERRQIGAAGGFLLALCLNWVGVGIVSCFAPQRACPGCAERIRVEAKVCRYCGARLRPQTR